MHECSALLCSLLYRHLRAADSSALLLEIALCNVTLMSASWLFLLHSNLFCFVPSLPCFSLPPLFLSLCSYWSALLQKRGVDVLSFDYEVRPKNCWSKVRRGGPEVLLDRAVRGETESDSSLSHLMSSPLLLHSSHVILCCIVSCRFVMCCITQY